MLETSTPPDSANPDRAEPYEVSVAARCRKHEFRSADRGHGAQEIDRGVAERHRLRASFAIGKAKAPPLEIDPFPLKTDDFTAAATGEQEQPNSTDCRQVAALCLKLLARISQRG